MPGRSVVHTNQEAAAVLLHGSYLLSPAVPRSPHVHVLPLNVRR